MNLISDLSELVSIECVRNAAGLGEFTWLITTDRYLARLGIITSAFTQCLIDALIGEGEC